MIFYAIIYMNVGERMKVNIHNEYGQLKSVVVSSADYFDTSDLALNNETIKHYAEVGAVPTKEAMLKEQACFWTTLKDFGVELLIADQVEGAKGQMFTRDLAFVIGDKFFISSMRKENRRLAINGWGNIINQIEPDKIVRVPSNIYLEGGDIVVDNKKVYVGISERTTMDGVKFLKNVLGDEYSIIPLKLKAKFLHLDVVFTIINPNLALIYKEGLEEESYNLLGEYTKIEVTEQEQFELATNVFVVDSQNIIINSSHKRIQGQLKKFNLNVVPIDLTETAKDGGAFRCTTCPIERK